MVDPQLMRNEYGLHCCICFAWHPIEDSSRLAVDKNGQKWDVCKGTCAKQAGIEEREE